MTAFTVPPDRPEVVVARTFDAPRALVFAMFTDPDALARWWGLGNGRFTVDVMELRPGGRWRYLEVDDEGTEHAFHGVYHRIAPPDLLVYTFEYEGRPDRVMLETVTFEDVDGRTRVTVSSVFQSLADRDWMIGNGMEYGKRHSMDALADLLAKAQAG